MDIGSPRTAKAFYGMRSGPPEVSCGSRKMFGSSTDPWEVKADRCYCALELPVPQRLQSRVGGADGGERHRRQGESLRFLARGAGYFGAALRECLKAVGAPEDLCRSFAALCGNQI